MLLPQSSAFGALKNRLNSVSAIGLLHTPASMPTSARPSVVAGIPSTSIPSATGTGAVSGRLGRTRDVNTGSDVKWPELMEKFKQTQEKARRRNERLLRGDDADGAAYAGSSGAGRSLLDNSAIGGPNGGRESRTSNRSAELGGRSAGGRNSALGRPLSFAGGAGGVGGAAGLSKAGGSNVPALAAGIAGAVAGGGGDNRVAPHKRGHSLAGGLGKFASGIARAGSSRDRDKDKEKGKR